jgi:hypothetical protein
MRVNNSSVIHSTVIHSAGFFPGDSLGSFAGYKDRQRAANIVKELERSCNSCQDRRIAAKIVKELERSSNNCKDRRIGAKIVKVIQKIGAPKECKDLEISQSSLRIVIVIQRPSTRPSCHSVLTVTCYHEY